MGESILIPGWWRTLVPRHYGYEKCKSGHSHGPAVRENYLIHYIFSGTGVLRANGTVYELSEGDIFIIHPGEVTKYQADSAQPWEYAWLGFEAPEGIEFLKAYSYHVPSLRHSFEQLRGLNRVDACTGDVYGVLYHIITELYKLFGSEGKDELHYTDRVRMLFETSYMSPLSVQGISDSLHIDRHYLCQLFKAEYGMSPKAYLTRTRLENAAKFIAQGYSVGETASMVGIPNASNFSRMYKNYFGHSPADVKKREK